MNATASQSLTSAVAAGERLVARRPRPANSASIARRLRVSAANPASQAGSNSTAAGLPSARSTIELLAAPGTKSAMSRAIRRASVSAPIATRSPSAASSASSGAHDSSRPARAIAAWMSRPGSVSATRHSSSTPRRQSPAASKQRAAASRATGSVRWRPSPNCDHASATSSSRPIATSASSRNAMSIASSGWVRP